MLTSTAKRIQGRRLERGLLTGRFARGVFWSLAGAAVAQGLALASQVVAARSLGQVQFGELSAINSTVGLFGVLAGMGLGLTTNRHVALLRTTDPVRAGEVIGLTSTMALVTGVLMAGSLFLTAPWVAAGVLAAPHLAGPLRLSCALLLVNALQGTQTGTLAGFEDFRAVARINVLQGAVMLPVTALMAGAWHLPGAVGAYLVTGVGVLAASHLTLRRICAREGLRVRYGIHRADLSILWTFSLPALLSNVALHPAQWLVRVWAVNRPGGYEQMAIFSAAFAWSTAIQFVPARVSSFMTSLLANLHGSDDRTSLRRAFWANLGIALGTATLVALPVALLAPWILAAYGPEYAAHALVLRLVCLSSILGAGSLALRNLYYGRGRLWLQVAFSAAWSLALLATLALLSPTALGLAVAYLAGYALLFALQVAGIRRAGLLAGGPRHPSGSARG